MPPEMEETRASGGGAAAAGGATGGGRARDRWYDPTPLLRPHRFHQQRPAGVSRRSVPFIIGRATTRRLMRSPPMVVRETAALQLEERQTDWGYSRPVVALDLIWSLAFVLVSCAVLLATARERPSTPIRVWILGYALHCLVHVGFVCFEYRRRQRRRIGGRDRWEVEAGDEEEEDEGSYENQQSSFLLVPRLSAEKMGVYTAGFANVDVSSWVMKKLESANAVISFFWWMLGFYWIVVGGPALLQDAPRLYCMSEHSGTNCMITLHQHQQQDGLLQPQYYNGNRSLLSVNIYCFLQINCRLTVVFLAFDVFFAVFCILLACIIGVALCCCLPCIIAILYAVTGQEGASDADLSSLPRFRFCRTNESELMCIDKDYTVAISVAEENCNSTSDHSFSPEDSRLLVQPVKLNGQGWGGADCKAQVGAGRYRFRNGEEWRDAVGGLRRDRVQGRDPGGRRLGKGKEGRWGTAAVVVWRGRWNDTRRHCVQWGMGRSEGEKRVAALWGRGHGTGSLWCWKVACSGAAGAATLGGGLSGEEQRSSSAAAARKGYWYCWPVEGSHLPARWSMEGKVSGIGPESADPGSDRSMRIRVWVEIPESARLPIGSECCICLSQYEEGSELCSLPCNHHFHSGCIVKWLRINATCPLCKYSILKGDEQV
ncbi:hypothetical protein Taro_028933 [Colocasia esculenta]|uniref:RING-type E3 ubiquitin transferase n=1 Tax=Colocasia esculenta TaxID=4460 RepID=A0A843VMI6_COLES|nr:hypothetical protein [Colocasia esculenta]